MGRGEGGQRWGLARRCRCGCGGVGMGMMGLAADVIVDQVGGP